MKLTAMTELGVLLLLAIPPFRSGPTAHCQAVPTSAGFHIKKLVIEVSRGGFPLPQSDIFVIDSQNSKPRRLAEGHNPAISPDGQKIAYCVREGQGFGQIQTINADGSGHVQMTKIRDGGCVPDWSPDGQKILFTAFGKTPTIMVMNKDGGGLAQVIEGGGARWSPDGKKLVFLRRPESRHASSSIWVANADGTDAKKVIEDNSNVLEANWDPDGHIVFSSEREQRRGAIFRINPDGSGLETLAIDNQLDFFFPVFSPDGKQLIVDSFPHGSSQVQELQLVHAEGKVLLLDQITHKGTVLARGMHPSVLWEKP